MSSACSAPITWEDLVAYWADDLEPAAVDRLDEHLIGCETCSAESARVSAVSAGLRAFIPVFADHARIEVLRGRGHRVVENVVTTDARKLVVFSADTDLLIHKLVGLDLTAAASVGIVVSVEETGHVLTAETDVPFDRDSGEVLLVCQRHFAAAPPNIVAEVRTRDAAGSEKVARYLIPHVYEPRTQA